MDEGELCSPISMLEDDVIYYQAKPITARDGDAVGAKSFVNKSFSSETDKKSNMKSRSSSEVTFIDEIHKASFSSEASQVRNDLFKGKINDC